MRQGQRPKHAAVKTAAANMPVITGAQGIEAAWPKLSKTGSVHESPLRLRMRPNEKEAQPKPRLFSQGNLVGPVYSGDGSTISPVPS